jgi:hypothetical protein
MGYFLNQVYRVFAIAGFSHNICSGAEGWKQIISEKLVELTLLLTILSMKISTLDMCTNPSVNVYF